MNRKFLLLFSILIVAIGSAGIMINTKNDEQTPYNFVDLKKEKEVKIILAQSIHDLSSGTLLTQNDYALKTIIVPESSELIKNNISGSTDINSHLLKVNLVAGSYITQDVLVSPDSNEFNYLNLKKSEVIYKFNITQKSGYLLDTLQVGDSLSFQLRVLETDKNKGMSSGTVINTKELSDKKSQTFSLNEIIPAMRIIRMKKYSTDELSEKNNKNQKTEEIVTGYISVVIKREELDIIHIAEKSGDIILAPSIVTGNHQSTNIYDIIPKLRITRELRG
ncbi:tight adherance operon protein [Yersinia intermedia]|uniref:Tight adherance operon protein n=1 Tax=Yersinia intermedia TaxID=631 RepID=A0A209A0K6_YERIN|nr:tight adherance operon protein [Yersinia intermedia]OVZ86272.1 tight adherance operon protein [Yersinia intermedia]